MLVIIFLGPRILYVTAPSCSCVCTHVSVMTQYGQHKHANTVIRMCLGFPLLRLGLKVTTKDIAWNTDMTAEQRAETVILGDSVVFTWTGTHDVYRFPDEAAFTSCDFAGATELAPTSVNTYTFETTSPGTFYFGCSVSAHCSEAGQKLALTVAGMFYMCVNSTSQPAVAM